MLNQKCRGIVYIDCMSNSGIYKDDKGEEIKGTPLLVSEIIAEAMTRYTNKQAYIYFNDLDSGKIDLLKTRLPKQTGNFTIYTESMDANILLRKIGIQFSTMFSDCLLYTSLDPSQTTLTETGRSTRINVQHCLQSTSISAVTPVATNGGICTLGIKWTSSRNR